MLSLLLGVDHFDAVTSREQLELLHSDRLFASEVPSDQVLELTFGEFKSTAFNQLSELLNVHLLRVFLLNSVEKSFKELVVLSFISELISVIRIESPHELAEFLFIDLVRLTICGI